MGSLQIDLHGSSFAIKANEESAYLEKLLGYYKRITEEVKKTGGLTKPVEIAIMSGITLVDELYKEKSKNVKLSKDGQSTDDEEVERLTLRMIDRIDKALE